MQERLQGLQRYQKYVGLAHPLDVLASPQGPWPVGLGVILAAHCRYEPVNSVLGSFPEAFPTAETARAKTVADLVPLLRGISHNGRKAESCSAGPLYLETRNGGAGS